MLCPERLRLLGHETAPKSKRHIARIDDARPSAIGTRLGTKFVACVRHWTNGGCVGASSLCRERRNALLGFVANETKPG